MVVSEGESWSFSSPWPGEEEKQLVCKWMPLPYSWMTRPSLSPSLPPSSPPSSPSIPPFCKLRVFRKRGTVEKRAIG